MQEKGKESINFVERMFLNTITPFLLEKTAVRGRFVRMDTVVGEILKRHQYPETIHHYLAELIVLGVTLSNAFKFDGVFTLQVQGSENSPVSFMVVDVDSKGHVRACAHYKEEHSPFLSAKKRTLMELFGAGYLAFSIDQGDDLERYQGIVELEGVTLKECLQHYFKQSEQLETAFYLNLTKDYQGVCIMLQKLPFDAETDNEAFDDWFTAMSLLSTVKGEEAWHLGPEELLHRLFWQEGLKVYDAKTVQFQCRCSREKLEVIMAQLSLEDKQAVTKDGVITVSCDYCGEVYLFEAGY